MNILRKFSMFALGVLFFIPGVPAQTPPKGEVKPLSIRVSFFSLDESVSGLSYVVGKKVTAVNVPSDFKPAPVRYDGPAPLVLAREVAGPGGVKVRTTVAEITPPRETGTYLVALKRVVGGSERYMPFVVDETSIKQPANNWCFINFTQANVLATVGSQRAVVPPGKSAHMDMGTAAGYFQGIFHRQQGKEWKKAYETRLYFYPGTPKVYMLFENSAISGHLQLKGVPVVLTDKAAK